LLPEHDYRGSNAQSVAPSGEAILDKIHALSPKDDRQRSQQAQAFKPRTANGQTRLLMLTQRSVPVPKRLLVMLIFGLIPCS
jgi:hypothetical protein